MTVINVLMSLRKVVGSILRAAMARSLKATSTRQYRGLGLETSKIQLMNFSAVKP